jgi:5'-nucleotidase/UDP-sugar diphosphatase
MGGELDLKNSTLQEGDGVVKFGIALLALMLVGTVGCSTKDKDTTASPTGAGALTDVAPAPVPYTPPATPVAYEPPPTPVAPVETTASSGGTYTVKKGDTLYGIARARYGDGKQWQRIANANPGVSPQSLKVGQTLVIP